MANYLRNSCCRTCVNAPVLTRRHRSVTTRSIPTRAPRWAAAIHSCRRASASPSIVLITRSLECWAGENGKNPARSSRADASGSPNRMLDWDFLRVMLGKNSFRLTTRNGALESPSQLCQSRDPIPRGQLSALFRHGVSIHPAPWHRHSRMALGDVRLTSDHGQKALEAREFGASKPILCLASTFLDFGRNSIRFERGRNHTQQRLCFPSPEAALSRPTDTTLRVSPWKYRTFGSTPSAGNQHRSRTWRGNSVRAD